VTIESTANSASSAWTTSLNIVVNDRIVVGIVFDTAVSSCARTASEWTSSRTTGFCSLEKPYGMEDRKGSHAPCDSHVSLTASHGDDSSDGGTIMTYHSANSRAHGAGMSAIPVLHQANRRPLTRTTCRGYIDPQSRS